ncbi:MAG TPA: tetratricopeptide repeat protein [Myxococcota bacterium]
MKLQDIAGLVRLGGAEGEAGIRGDAHLRLRLFAIVAVCFAVYSNALQNGFVYDDFEQVIENRWLRDLSHAPEVFSKGVWGFSGDEQSNYYRPLMHLSYMVTYAVFGLRPWAFHLVNLLFHAGVSALVFLVGLQLQAAARSKLSPNVPFVAALLFAAHPIHTEAVAWVAGIPELSFSLLFLLSFCLYARASAADRERRALPYLLSLSCFFLATLSKETALTLPLALVAYDLAVGRGPFRPLPLLRRYLPYALVGVAYLAIRMAVLGGFAGTRRHTELSGYEYFINVFPLVARYLAKLLWPAHLNAFHQFDPIHSLLEWEGALSLAATCAFLGFLALTYWKDRLSFFSASLTAIPLLPVLYIPALGENTFTERYLYLPSVGYALLLASFFAWLAQVRPRTEPALRVLVLAVLAAYAAGTLGRNPIWRDDLSLWTDTVAKSPGSIMPRSELGVAYATRGETAKAIEQYQIVLRMSPAHADAHSNLGLVYDELGRLDEAIQQHQQALRLKPDSAAAHNNLGLVLSKQGRLDEAIEHYRESLRLEPLSPGVHNNLGNAYQAIGLLDAAIDEYREALEIRRDFPDTYINLGVAYAKKGMIDAALEQFLAAERLAPDNPLVLHNLANAYTVKGFPEKAKAYRQKAANPAAPQRPEP